MTRALAALALALLSARALGVPTYVVDSVDGAFELWRPTDAAWAPVKKGALVPMGALLQTLSGGSLRLSRVDANASDEDKAMAGVTIQAEQTMTVRVTEDLAREVVTTSLYADAMNPGDLKKNASKDEAASIGAAWKRTTALMLAKGGAGAKGLSAGAASEDQKGDKKGEKVKPVPLVNPKNGAILVVDRLPALVAVKWVQPAAGAYDVLIGERDAEKPALAGTSRDGYLVMPLFHEGSYMIEVAAKDGLSASERTQFYLVMSRQPAAP